jgi:hypothetical protein
MYSFYGKNSCAKPAHRGVHSSRPFIRLLRGDSPGTRPRDGTPGDKAPAPHDPEQRRDRDGPGLASMGAMKDGN